MTVQRHTPGPWELRQSPVSGRYHVSIPHDALNIEPMVVFMAKENRQANVRLITAAPVLLAALETIRDYQPEHVYPSEELLQAIRDCPDCEHARQRHWPPSGLCNEHYTARSRLESENEHADAFQHLGMKLIARKAIAKATESEEAS